MRIKASPVYSKLADAAAPPPEMAARLPEGWQPSQHQVETYRAPHRPLEIEAIERRDDGSALVRGTTDSIFWATQALMHYRYNCRVLGGPEMLREMRATVRKMAEMYAEQG